MKFGKTIQRLCVDEWRKWYVDYKSLKKVIKRLQIQLEEQVWEDEQTQDIHTKTVVAQNGQQLFLAALSKEAAKVNRLYLDEVTLWETQYEEMISVLRTYQTSTFTPLMTSHKKAKQRARRVRKIKLKKQQQQAKKQTFTLKQDPKEATSTSSDSDTPELSSEASVQSAFGGNSALTDLETDTEIPEHLVRQFTAWCMQLDKMRSFCLLNHVAFIKIVKKYDKKVNRLIANSLRSKPTSLTSPTSSAATSTSSSSPSPSPTSSTSTSMDWDIPVPSIKDECMSSIMQQPFYCSLRLANLITRAECVASLLTETPSSADFQCPVCLDVLSNPVVLSCAHRFCWDCLARASATQSKCPVCRKQQSLDPHVYQVNDCLDSFLACHFPNEYKPRKTSLPLCPPSNLTSPLTLMNGTTSTSSSSVPNHVIRNHTKRFRTVPSTRSPLPGSLASLFSSISAQTQRVVDKEFAGLLDHESQDETTPISRSLPWSVHSTRTAQLLQARYATAPPLSMTPPVGKHDASSSLPISPKIRPYDSELDCDTFDDLVASEFFLGPGSAPITIPTPASDLKKKQHRSILSPDPTVPTSTTNTLTSKLSPQAREFVPSNPQHDETLAKTPELGMTQLTLEEDEEMVDESVPTKPTISPTKSLLSDAVASVRAQRISDADSSASATAAAAVAAGSNPPSPSKAPIVTGSVSQDNNPIMGLEFGTTPDAHPPMHDPIPVQSLHSISGLLQHAHPGCYIALDIDETIHINKYQPCMMMSEKGIQAFQIILSASPSYKHLHFSAKNHLTKKMQTALHQKRFVEHDTGKVIQELQKKGCHVFGLTARYSDMAAATVRELHSLGIDFTLTSPFPKGKMMRDPSTEAVCQDGIIFTNANEKGPIFDRFLSSILIHGGADGQTFIDIPSHIVFADDREQNAQSVLTGLTVAEKLNIHITSYHYCPPATCHDAGDDGDDAGHDVEAIVAAAQAVTAEYAAGSPTMSSMQLNSDAIEIDILQFQIHHFLNTTHILSDHQARRLWSLHKQNNTPIKSPATPITNGVKKVSNLTPTVNYNKRPAVVTATVGNKKQQLHANNPIIAQASASTSTSSMATSTASNHPTSRPIPIPSRR